MTGPPGPLLDVWDLSVDLPAPGGPVHAARGVSLAVRPGEVLAVVGESGAGKSVTALAIMGLLPRSAVVRGSVVFRGRQLVGLDGRDWRLLRGREMAMVFQDPFSSLNPVLRVGAQVAEAVLAHQPVSRAAARARAVSLLSSVGVADPERRARQFPYELSGGLRQRVVIAMAIANDPALIIADEPTSALDVTVQAEVMDTMRRARAATGAAMLLISHDLALVSGVADRVAVMYAGRVVETASVDELFYRPRMPYTIALLSALPSALPLALPAARAIPGRSGPQAGCPFAPRCPIVASGCLADEPPLVAVNAAAGGEPHLVACRRVEAAALLADRPGVLPRPGGDG